MTEISEDKFSQLIENKDRNVFCFTAKWCDACKTMKPFIKGLQRDYPSINFYSVDVMKMQDPLTEVQALPTYLGFTNHNKNFVVYGADRKKLVEYCEELLLD